MILLKELKFLKGSVQSIVDVPDFLINPFCAINGVITENNILDTQLLRIISRKNTQLDWRKSVSRNVGNFPKTFHFLTPF